LRDSNLFLRLSSQGGRKERGTILRDDPIEGGEVGGKRKKRSIYYHHYHKEIATRREKRRKPRR